MMTIKESQELFLEDKKFQGLTDNSIQSYINLFKLWNSWLIEENIKEVGELSPRVAKKFLLACQKKGNAPRTVNSKLKLLRSYARWLSEEGHTQGIFTQGIKLIKQDERPKILDQKDLLLVLRKLKRNKKESFISRRNWCLILFLAGTGLRLNELCSLSWKDIDLDSYLVSINKSKARKSQSVPLSNELAKELFDWKQYLESKFGELPSSVFVTTKGTVLSKNAIQSYFKRTKKQLNLESDFSPHTLRNFFIKNLLKRGANLREVQLLARHSKIEVTKQYIGYYQHELKEALDEADPLRGLI